MPSIVQTCRQLHFSQRLLHPKCRLDTPRTRKEAHAAKQKRKREKRKAKREERAAAEGLARLGRAERAHQSSQKAKVHFFAEFSVYGACRNMKIASDPDEMNAPVNFGVGLCDTKKIMDQIFDQSKVCIAMTRLHFNGKFERRKERGI